MQFQIGPEFLPSYVDEYENNLVIPTGEVVEILEPDEIDAIEVHGTLRIRADLRFINLTVAEGGVLEILDTAALTKKDAELDTDFDPFQWGQGIQCFGTWKVLGRKLTQTWSLIQPVEKDGTTLVLDYLPADWQVGDSLLIPDTRQIGENPIRYESPVTIAAIEFNTITLSKPLDFEHHTIKHPLTGDEIIRPAVANCTRSIVFRSENPDAVSRRGHVAVIHTGQADVRYASFIGLGRTTDEALDSTPLDRSRVGTNQIAKYGFHAHHVAHHDAGSTHGGVHIIGCHVDGLGGSKWGIVDHTSPGFHAEENVITGHTGSALVTEDGNETGYLFKRNFCHGAIGNGLNGKNTMISSDLPPSPHYRNAPGGEGAGIWHHSANGRTLENYCINNAIGIQWMYRNHPGKNLVQIIPPVENARNVCVSNSSIGLDTWNAPAELYADDQVCANNFNGVVLGPGEPGNIILRNPKLVNTGNVGSGIHASAAYSDSIQIFGGVISGFRLGLLDSRTIKVIGTDLRGNALDIRFDVPTLHGFLMDSVEWDTFEFRNYKGMEFFYFKPLEAQKHLLKNYRGKDYALVHPWQQADVVAGLAPYPELTNKEVYVQHELAPDGYIYDVPTVELPGLSSGLAIPLGVVPDPDPDDCEELRKQVAALKAEIEAWKVQVQTLTAKVAAWETWWTMTKEQVPANQ